MSKSVAARGVHKRTLVTKVETLCKGKCAAFTVHAMYRIADDGDPHHVLVCRGCKRQRRLETSKLPETKIALSDIEALYRSMEEAELTEPEPDGDDDE